MSIGSPIGKLFGSSPIRPLQQHMQLVSAAVKQVVSMIDASLDADHLALRKGSEQIHALVQEGAALKYQIRGQLPRGLFLAMPRPDLLELLAAQDRLLALCRHLARGVLFRDLVLPASTVKGVSALGARCEQAAAQALEAIELLDELLETGFGSNEAKRVSKLLDALDRRLLQAERQCDKLRQQLRRAEGEGNPLELHFSYRLLDEMDRLSHAAAEIGERLRLLLAH